MRTNIFPLLLALTVMATLPPDALCLEQTAKIVTLTDAAGAVPHAKVVSGYHGQEPPAETEGATDIPQLPGWPIQVGMDPSGLFITFRNVAFADLDNNGTQEIITASTDGFVHAWDYTGTYMAGFPFETIEMPGYVPSVADLDADGDMEIVFFTSTWRGGGRFYILDHEGDPLPGFPVSVNDHPVEDSPTLYDLDNDGVMEIIVPERADPIGYLHIFEMDGTEWGGNWPVALDHVPATCAAVGDVDADGEVEICFCSYMSIYLLETDGTSLPGWPHQISNSRFSYQSPALADLDGNGDLEIIVSTHYYTAGCYIFHHDATPYPGWPKIYGTWSFCPPAVADLEGDGELEIICGREGIFGGQSACFWAWTSSGAVKPGFPYMVDHGGGSDGPITVADINNDGIMEILADHNYLEIAGTKGWLFGVDAFGSDLPGFPIRPVGLTMGNGATIGDVDGDGDYELGVVTHWELNEYVNLYTPTGTYHSSDIPWATYHQKNTRGGLYRGEDRLNAQGYYGIGSTVNLCLHDDPGNKAFLYASLGLDKRFLPMFGWLYLDWTLRLPPVLFNATIPAEGEIMVPVTIPNNPGLVGRDFYIQGLIGSNPPGGEGSLTNLISGTIQPAR
jgi:hypothetical protein